MNGRLCLRAGLRHGRTVLLEAEGTYPLQVTRPHALSGDGGLSLVVLLLSGGLLDGDQLSTRVTLEAGARLALRTQAATQLHAGRSGQTLEANVAEHAWFSYVPHCVVPHAGADFHSRMSISMRPGARVLVAEALAPGRVQHGEAFAYEQVQLDLDAWCGVDLVARERARVRPDLGLLAPQFGGGTHTAGAYMLGPSAPLPDETWAPSRIAWSQLACDGRYIRVVARRAADIDESLARVHQAWWLADRPG